MADVWLATHRDDVPDAVKFRKRAGSSRPRWQEARSWTAFDDHLADAAERLQSADSVNSDIAIIVEQAAELAEAAGQEAPVEAARSLANSQGEAITR